MPGKTIKSTALSPSVTNGRQGFTSQWWPDVGVGSSRAPLLPPGAHFNGPNNALTAFSSRGNRTNVNAANPGNTVSHLAPATHIAPVQVQAANPGPQQVQASHGQTPVPFAGAK
jgi:hypothetical protein